MAEIDARGAKAKVRRQFLALFFFFFFLCGSDGGDYAEERVEMLLLYNIIAALASACWCGVEAIVIPLTAVFAAWRLFFGSCGPIIAIRIPRRFLPVRGDGRTDGRTPVLVKTCVLLTNIRSYKIRHLGWSSCLYDG